MQSQRHNLKRGAVSFSMVIVMSLFVPMSAYADVTNPDTTTTTPPTQTVVDPAPVTPVPTPAPVADPTPTPAPAAPVTTPVPPTIAPAAVVPGPTKPNGSDGTTFAYNSVTGLWENDLFSWDPVTHKTTPKTPQQYSYNPVTGKWDTTQYIYSPSEGKYIPNTYAMSQPPAGAVVDPSGTSAVMPNNLPNNVPNSQYNGFFNASISNLNNTQATSGNALIDSNTFAGNAGTGNATAMSNLFNLLQSSTNFLGNGQLNTFNANIQGNVLGDLLINPGAIGSLSATSGSTPVGNLAVNTQNNGVINNNLTVGANTGNATLTNNTNAGNATTGNANAVANVINMLNSAVNSGQSFLGAINIYGNLNGDILFPPGFLDSLLASNAASAAPATAAPVTTTCNTGCGSTGNNTTNLTNNSAINNNINSNAATGNATIANNSNAGNATTGNAMSNVTLLNLTGHQIVGKNDLLVFVNVLGKWYGMIMNAPAGATAANIGGGISQDTTGCGCNGNTTLNATNNSAINNNINVGAQSGDATIAGNSNAGNATTGNATTSVNLANFIDSHLALSDWFGILFINVFGTWNGSFGVNTSAGDAPAAPTPAATAPTTTAAKPHNMFGFVPKAAAAATQAITPVAPASTDSNSQNDSTKVLGASDTSGPSTPASTHTSPSWLMPIIGSIIAALLLGAEQVISRRQKRDELPVVSNTGHITTTA